MLPATTISIILVLIGIVFMIFGIKTDLKIRKIVPRSIKTKWNIIIIFSLFILLGYIFFIIHIVIGSEFAVEFIASIIFLGGAIFVSIINKISSHSIKTISRNDELEKMNNELKTAIADRDKTQKLLKISNEELKKTNVLVEKKIKERTKELKSDIDQLQRYKDITVDRELRLIELKKEVNKVLIKYGEKPKYYK